jgi:hypothetical protein
VAVGFFIPYLFHGPRAGVDAAAEKTAGTAAASLQSTPLFSVSGVW